LMSKLHLMRWLFSFFWGMLMRCNGKKLSDVNRKKYNLSVVRQKKYS
jgi:hypothetical protein